MASRAAVPFLVAMMLLTGVCNTLLTKYQDNQCVRNCDADDASERAHFNQPVLQTAQMFLGEMGCWLVVGIMHIYNRFARSEAHTHAGYRAVGDGSSTEVHEDEAYEPAPDTLQPPKPMHDEETSVLKGFRITLLALPAVCDICGTTLMNAGLLMVAASIYQMTRGALVLFVGLFSVIFLRRRLLLFQWVSLMGVVMGVAVVGVAGATTPNRSDNIPQITPKLSAVHLEDESSTALRAVVGVLLIAGAQIFTAAQFVLEEWILERSDIEPIKVVGWEGIFGFVVTAAAMFLLHVLVGQTESGRYGYFDMAEGWRQLTTYPSIYISSMLIMLSIGGFNFFGLSVTRNVSATSRSTIDTCRTLFIWLVSLGLGWETFKWLQVVGFILLVYFTFLFNGLVQPPFKFLLGDEEIEELLPEEPIEHQ